MFAHKAFLYYYKDEMKAFYQDINSISFKGITANRITELIETSKSLNKLFNNKNIERWKVEKYIIVMNQLKMNQKKYKFNNDTEKLLLLMFAVDPSFEAAIICGECNRIDEMKIKMESVIGVYDPNLIKIENYFIKHFLSQKSKNKINQEIEKRVFK